MVTSRNEVAFGSTSKRFGTINVHPSLDPSGLYTVRDRGCDPCLYHPLPPGTLCEASRIKKTIKDPWRSKVELEDWAKNLGYRNQKILAYRKYRDSVLGPAWHSVEWPAKYTSACKNVGFGMTPRFRPTKNTLPGPGTYYKEHPFKAPYGSHSVRPTLEREEPCRFKDTVPKWSLAPDRYRIVDRDCIAEKPKKLVSRRGPYDLFTGKRDGSTIKNHFSTNTVYATTWPLALPGCMEKYRKTHFGEMKKTNMDVQDRSRGALVDLTMCYRRPQDAGPTHYPVDVEPTPIKQNKRPFHSTYDKGPGYQRVVVWPGVGRYSPSGGRCGLPGQGHRHVFLSKVPRTIGATIPKPMNTF